MGLYGLLVCVGLCFPGKIAEAQKRERETKTTQKASRYEAPSFLWYDNELEHERVQCPLETRLTLYSKMCLITGE